MSGLLTLAYKLLVNDRGKFAALIVGLIFSVFLMIQTTSLFAGILLRASSAVLNIGAALVKLNDGMYKSATVVGLDDTSLYGRPDVVERPDAVLKTTLAVLEIEKASAMAAARTP